MEGRVCQLDISQALKRGVRAVPFTPASGFLEQAPQIGREQTRGGGAGTNSG